MAFKQSFSYITGKELVSLLRNPGFSYRTRIGSSFNPSQDNKIAVVDVRDDDHEGGHIRGCIHSPSTNFLNGGIEKLREKVKDTPVLVFHCALSQVRGPKAARIYAESTDELRKLGGDAPIPQEVYVLRGGFSEFQALYKNDKDLIEDYDPDFWE